MISRINHTFNLIMYFILMMITFIMIVFLLPLWLFIDIEILFVEIMIWIQNRYGSKLES